MSMGGGGGGGGGERGGEGEGGSAGSPCEMSQMPLALTIPGLLCSWHGVLYLFVVPLYLLIC